LAFSALPKSTFYDYLNKAEPLEEDKRAPLEAKILAIYDKHKGRYGYRRISMELRKQGEVVNHKKVLRLMGRMGLKSLVRAKKYKSYKGEEGKTAPNILNRDFSATQHNQRWVSDITEFKVAGQKLYLSPILDLYNGEIISYDISRRPVFKQVTDMLLKAFEKIEDDTGLILHSDQGWQYRMQEYQSLLKGKGIVQSMSRKGNCFDNAAMESFFGTLKSEMFYLQSFDSIEALTKELENYIYYYNNSRIKLKLKGLSPVQYRTQADTLNVCPA
jgi:transposase InsO family protein